MKTNLEQWSMNDLLKLFQSDVSRQTILKAEKEKRIPAANRLEKGLKARAWPIEALPFIGKQYGFLKPVSSQVRICVYTAKGGVLKTTITYTLARILALHGMKTLIIGLDSQGSVSALALNPLVNIDSIDKIPTYKNVGDVLFNDCSLEDAIQNTSLPTLDILPETDSLTDEDNRIGAETAIAATKKVAVKRGRFEYFTRDLLPKLDEYEVVIFDNSPSWSFLIENSLFAADYVISPTACDPGSFQVLENNLNAILDFKDRVGKEWKRLFLVPTLKDNNKLSSQIHAAYLTRYPGFVTQSSIRKTVKGAEAFSLGASPIEHDVNSDLSSDYFDLIKEIWRVVRAENAD